MAEPIIEQIAEWIKDALNGQADPGGTLTLKSIRPKILDWRESDFAHGDVIIELVAVNTISKTTVESRTEKGIFKCYGIVRNLPADTKADTVLARMTETIRRLLLAGNTGGKACGTLALNIDCPAVDLAIFNGGLETIVTVEVEYPTPLKDGYA